MRMGTTLTRPRGVFSAPKDGRFGVSERIGITGSTPNQLVDERSSQYCLCRIADAYSGLRAKHCVHALCNQRLGRYLQPSQACQRKNLGALLQQARNSWCQRGVSAHNTGWHVLCITVLIYYPTACCAQGFKRCSQSRALQQLAGHITIEEEVSAAG